MAFFTGPPSETSDDRNDSDVEAVDESEQSKFEMTLGVELEFMLLWMADPARNIEPPSLSDVEMLLWQTLSEPIEATCSTCGREHHFSLPLHTPADRPYADYERWQPDKEYHLQLKLDELEIRGDENQSYGMELRSRILRPGKTLITTPSSDDPGHTHEISYSEEMRAVLARLNHHFNTPAGCVGPRKSYRLALNETCGLHVHVGNESRGFPLRTIKNVVSAYLTNERLIDSMHSANRIGGSTLLTEDRNYISWTQIAGCEMQPLAYNRALSMDFILNAYCTEIAVADDDSFCYCPPMARIGLERIYPMRCFDVPGVQQAALAFDRGSFAKLVQLAPGLRSLREMQGSFPRAVTVNLLNLLPAGKSTIEFRQHAGSLRHSEVDSWVEFVVGMVDYCHHTPDDSFQERLQGEWLSPDHNVDKLLTTFKCPQRVNRHYVDRSRLSGTGPSSSSTAAIEEMREIDAFGMYDPLRSLMLCFADKRAKNTNPFRIQDRINDKFRVGGYGRFSEAYLDTMSWGPDDAELRKRLTIPVEVDKHDPEPAGPSGSRVSEDSASIEEESAESPSAAAGAADKGDPMDALSHAFGNLSTARQDSAAGRRTSPAASAAASPLETVAEEPAAAGSPSSHHSGSSSLHSSAGFGSPKVLRRRTGGRFDID